MKNTLWILKFITQAEKQVKNNQLKTQDEVFKNIEKTFTLYHSPKRGRILPELQEQGILRYREVIIPPWRIIYRMSEKIFIFYLCSISYKT